MTSEEQIAAMKDIAADSGWHKDVKSLKVETASVLFYLSDDSCHQVVLSDEQIEMVKQFVNSLFPGAVPLHPKELPLAYRKGGKAKSDA